MLSREDWPGNEARGRSGTGTRSEDKTTILTWPHPVPQVRVNGMWPRETSLYYAQKVPIIPA